MLSLWIIANGRPSKKYPLISRFQYQQAINLANRYKEELKVTYFSIDIRSIRRRRKLGFNTYEEDGMKIIECSFPIGKVPMEIQNNLYSFFLRRVFKKELKVSGQPDIIHSHFTDMGYAVCKNRELLPNTRIILTEHASSMMQPDLCDKEKKRAGYTYNNVDAIISVSPALVDSIRDKFGIETIYIPNMINEEQFFYSKKSKETDCIKILSVGNLITRKNFAGLIKCFCKVFKAEDMVQLIIVGDGPQYKNLCELIKRNHRQHQIFLVGQLDNEQVALYMRKSDCFALFSEYETFGVVFAEAVMCGLPIIATDSGGPRCIVDKNNGILIPYGDEEKAENSLKLLIDRLVNYDRIQIAMDAREKFSEDNVSKKIYAVYQSELLKRTHSNGN